MSVRPSSAFDHERLIGTVVEVGAGYVKVNLPRAAQPTARSYHGHRVGGGEVGEFVLIESGEYGLFGKISIVRLPERERLTVEAQLGVLKDPNPVGEIQLLASINFVTDAVTSGITRYPRLGERVFSAPPDVVAWVLHDSRIGDDSTISLDFARMSDSHVEVSATPESLFGRHCAVVGTTGGGKSWTIARLIEEAAKHNAKVVLLDATGEFKTLVAGVQHARLGNAPPGSEAVEEIAAPYYHLTENDIFAIFKPAGQSQAPKLRAAIKSLKLARKMPALTTDGVILKANKPRAPYEAGFKKFASFVDGPDADFDIENLVAQIDAECVWPNDKYDSKKWGGTLENDRTYCVGLVTRIDQIINAPEMECVMRPGTKRTVATVLEEFVGDNSVRVLRISLQHVSFQHNAREIVANAIGRRLLQMARAGKFTNRPLVVCVDEAHQFFGKSIGDEFSKFELDAFELIAKEGRKYGLTICIATQRPRDIVEGVLSQMGTFIVHRLINDRDREVIERAASDLDSAAARIVPTLGQGEALILGVDFTIPIVVRITPPVQEPDSHGPDFQTNWSPE